MALAAGNYRGPIGPTYHQYRRPNVARHGLSLRAAVQRGVLGSVGLKGLGDLCDDTGWTFARALIGGAGTIVGAIDAGAKDPGAATYTGAGLTTVSNAWGAACTAQSGDGDATSSAELEAMLAAERARNEAAIADARRSQEQTMQMMAALSAQRQQPPQPKGIDTTTLLIGGGILGAVVLAIALLK